jgi:hypothetical protein
MLGWVMVGRSFKPLHLSMLLPNGSLCRGLLAPMSWVLMYPWPAVLTIPFRAQAIPRFVATQFRVLKLTTFSYKINN